MAAIALIRFSQGVTIGSPGVAFSGVAGQPVTVENDSITDIQSWKIDMLYVPPGSAVPLGTIATGDTNTPIANFTPDAIPGSYRVLLTVYTGIGQSGVSNRDIRVFGVPDPNGFIFPPYQQLPPKLPVTGSGITGEKPDEMNFGNHPYGWDGVGNDGLLLDFMRQMSSALAVISGSVAFIHNPVVTSGMSPYGAVIRETVKVDPTGGAITVDLPTAVGNTGLQIQIVNVTTAVNPVTVDPSGAQTINGQPTFVMNTPEEVLRIESDGSNWVIL